MRLVQPAFYDVYVGIGIIFNYITRDLKISVKDSLQYSNDNTLLDLIRGIRRCVY